MNMKVMSSNSQYRGIPCFMYEHTTE